MAKNDQSRGHELAHYFDGLNSKTEQNPVGCRPVRGCLPRDNPSSVGDDETRYAVSGDDLCQRLDALVAAVDAAAREICEYASAYDDPVLVTEDSHYSPDLWTRLTAPNAHRSSSWLLPAAHLRLRAVAAEYRLPVTPVPEAYSTQECHACGVLGTRELNTTSDVTIRTAASTPSPPISTPRSPRPALLPRSVL